MYVNLVMKMYMNHMNHLYERGRNEREEENC